MWACMCIHVCAYTYDPKTHTHIPQAQFGKPIQNQNPFSLEENLKIFVFYTKGDPAANLDFFSHVS